MKATEKKDLSPAPAPKTEQPHGQPAKQTSGDKAFDDAIDLMLKKRAYTQPVK